MGMKFSELLALAFAAFFGLLCLVGVPLTLWVAFFKKRGAPPPV